MQPKSEMPKSQPAAAEPEGQEGGAGGAKGALSRLEVHCDNCERIIEDLQSVISEKALKKGFAQVGFTCPYCRTWFHAYYTNGDLEQARKILERFKTNAGKSAKDWQRYKVKQTQFQKKHDRVQEKAKKIFREVVNSV